MQGFRAGPQRLLESFIHPQQMLQRRKTPTGLRQSVLVVEAGKLARRKHGLDLAVLQHEVQLGIAVSDAEAHHDQPRLRRRKIAQHPGQTVGQDDADAITGSQAQRGQMGSPGAGHDIHLLPAVAAPLVDIGIPVGMVGYGLRQCLRHGPRRSTSVHL